MTLTILGEPMGKQRPRFSTVNGFVKTYTQAKTLNYETLVKHEYMSKYDKMFFSTNSQLGVKIVAYFSIPKSHYRYHKKTNTTDLDKIGQQMKDGFIMPTKKPDTDNIAKLVLDSLNGIAYPDDAQVVCLEVHKLYDENPRVEMEIYEI